MQHFRQKDSVALPCSRLFVSHSSVQRQITKAYFPLLQKKKSAFAFLSLADA